MPLKNFLNRVLPNEGYKCWVEISKDKVATQGLVATIDDLAAKLLEIDSRGVDAYFGCAAFATPRNRRAANALGAKAIWADVDVGENKPYATFEDAVYACDQFCDRVGVPLPGIVRSGSGLHIYWPLERMLARDEWIHITQRLKLLTHSQQFHCDPTRTADIASILRPPGTKNYKLPTPRNVAIDDWECFEPVSYEEFSAAVIKNTDGLTAQNIKNPLVANTPNASLTAGISVSKAFDASKGIVEGSGEYGGRNNACAVFAGGLLQKGYQPADVMAACLQWNQLNQPPLPEQEVRTTVNSIVQRHKLAHPAPPTPPEAPTMPKAPFGFSWDSTGQLAADIFELDAEGKKIPGKKVIARLPVYLKSFLNEEGHKQKNSYLFCHYHPVKGWSEFTMNAKEFNGSEWYGLWVENGCSIIDGCEKLFKTYVRRAEVMLRSGGKEMVRYSQFGWKNEDKSFLVGEYMCHSDGHVEKAVGTDRLAPLMKSLAPARTGSLAAWTTAANKLGTPGMEAHLFMVLASLAAPLMKFCVDEGNGGSILSIVSEDSGHGKTPMATAAASVWGELSGTVVTGNFTENRRIEELVRHCHLPQIQEEAAYSDPLIASLGIEKFTSGTDRGRLSQGGMATGTPERYQTILLSLSNKSLLELVKMVNVPMSRRIFEIEIDRPDADDLANLGGVAREMMRNHGHAGLQFARIIVNPDVRAYIEQHLRGTNTGKIGSTQQKYRDLLNSRPEHRFIVWLLSAVEVAAQICRQYQILHFDVERIMKWVVQRALERVDGPREDAAAIQLNSFMAEHLNECITVAGPFSPGSGPQMPLRLPTRTLSMRLEMRNERLYISHESMNRWCTKNNVSFIGLGKRLMDLNILIERSKPVTLAAGTEIASGRTLCWMIDMGHPMIKGELRLELREPPTAKEAKA